MIGYVVWGLLFAGMLVVEGLGLTLRGHQWPTMSDMFRSVTRPTAGRWIFFALWLWTGWHFFIRGWHFFLRGSGAQEPGGPGGGKSVSATITQVVTPLLGLYLMLVAVTVFGYRAARRNGGRHLRVSLGEGARLARARPLAFLRYTIVTCAAGYVLLDVTMALYELIVGSSAAGDFGSAVLYGAFLAFAVAVPAFVALSFAEAAIRRRAARPTRLPGR